MSDDAELNQRMAEGSKPAAPAVGFGLQSQPASPTPSLAEGTLLASLVQWTTDGGARFVPASHTAKTLPPGLYAVNVSPAVGVYFERIAVKTEGILRFPHTNSDRVLAEIRAFWDRRDIFERAGLTHKRGIMLWGPPGAGKSCTIQLVMADVVARGGIGIQFTDAGLFVVGMRILREIQPQTPVVVLMEDLDTIVRRNDESVVLNLLDGAELVDRTVFLASTNYPEYLGPRILNRPSRFDKRFKVGYPTEESRAIYLQHIAERAGQTVPVRAWAVDTEGFSFAHLKELFVAVNILGDDYGAALETLRSMRERISSEQDGGRAAMGFGSGIAGLLGRGTESGGGA